jgi:hypothetical protein
MLGLLHKKHCKSNGLKHMTLHCPVAGSQTFNRLALACQICDLLVLGDSMKSHKEQVLGKAGLLLEHDKLYLYLK